MKKLLYLISLFSILFSGCYSLYHIPARHIPVNQLPEASNREEMIAAMQRKGFPDSHIPIICDGEVRIGFTYEEVTWAIGDPDETNRTEIAGETSLQCIYNINNYKSHYYYFTNNILTAIQD